ncbi:MAG: hypothetical protein ACHQT5_01845 [Candidatus Saccharimonadales bacterium]
MNKRLKVLFDQEYIGRRYDNSYQLQAKFATYFLLPKGIAVLKEQSSDVKYQVLRNLRNDAHVSERFIRHSINVFSVYACLRAAYINRFQFYTKSHMNGKEDYPEPLPDAHLCFQNVPGMEHTKFLLEFVDGTRPHRIWRQRISRLIEYIDAGEWPESDISPALLFVCETPALEKRVRRWAYQAYEDALAEDVFVATATVDTVAQAVLHAKSPEAL